MTVQTAESIAALISVVVLAVMISVASTYYGYWSALHEAFERGYAVQCVGKAGYYWECEE